MTLPFSVSTADAWDTVMKDKQNRASNQRIETIPQKVSRLFIYRCFFSWQAERAAGSIRTARVDLGPAVSEEAF
jgi:hypothetical protein